MTKKKYVITIFFIVIIFVFTYNYFDMSQIVYNIYLPIKKTIIDKISQINILLNKNLDYDKLKIKNINLKIKISNQNIIINEFNQFEYNQKLYLENRKHIILVKTMSYQRFNDFSKIYLLSDEALQENKVFGLIYNNLVAGIAIKKDNKLEGILLSSQKCRIAVSIGKNKIPGIAKGLDSRNMKIYFISKWDNINIGDEVLTNGLDNIFIPNLLIGKIVNITMKHPFIEAIVKFDANIKYPNYFYLIKNR